jgi:Flp pilus assembly protein TadG
MLSKPIRNLARNRRGSVAAMAAIVLPVLAVLVALVANGGQVLVTKTENQRIADIAAYAGGLAYSATSSTTSMTAAAQRIALINGLSASNVAASLGTSPRSPSKQAVSATMQSSDAIQIYPLLSSQASLTITANAYAELESSGPGCVIALKQGGTGITLSGGTAISAPTCVVASNNTITVPCGTSINAEKVTYGSAAVPTQGCNGITASSITQALTVDPLSGNSGVTTATARLSTVESMTSPSGPSVSGGTTITFDYSGSATIPLAAAGCTSSFSSPTWTVNCNLASAYTFGTLSVSGGISVVFNTRAGATYNVNGAINNTGGGTRMTFGSGTFNIAAGITNTGNLAFGAGTFSVGASTSACNGGGKYSLCNTSTLTFGGPSSFTLAAGIYNGGGSTITLGSGSTNSFNIGASSDGNSLYMGGSAVTALADATGTGDVFQLAGNLNVAGGGSCLAISAAAQHDINGYVSTAGGMTLGAGVYTVSGYIALGENGGGDVTCNGSTVGVNGTGVTLVTGGLSSPGSSPCSYTAFCVTNGYSNVTLTAPTSGTTAELLVIGPTSTSNSLGATFTEGASNTSLSGAFYFPHGPFSMSGGASVGNGSGQCLELVASQITLSGGTTAASTCISGSSGTSTVALVQ